MTYLLDTSFLLASAFAQDKNHLIAAQAMQALNLRIPTYIAEPVLGELFYMVSTRLSYNRAVQHYAYLQAEAFNIVGLMPEDRVRMVEIMQQYYDAELDYADVAQVAVAERLNISTIYTFDRRDFSIIRPNHVPYFTLLP